MINCPLFYLKVSNIFKHNLYMLYVLYISGALNERYNIWIFANNIIDTTNWSTSANVNIKKNCFIVLWIFNFFLLLFGWSSTTARHEIFNKLCLEEMVKKMKRKKRANAIMRCTLSEWIIIDVYCTLNIRFWMNRMGICGIESWVFVSWEIFLF